MMLLPQFKIKLINERDTENDEYISFLPAGEDEGRIEF